MSRRAIVLAIPRQINCPVGLAGRLVAAQVVGCLVGCATTWLGVSKAAQAISWQRRHRRWRRQEHRIAQAISWQRRHGLTQPALLKCCPACDVLQLIPLMRSLTCPVKRQIALARPHSEDVECHCAPFSDVELRRGPSTRINPGDQ